MPDGIEVPGVVTPPADLDNDGQVPGDGTPPADDGATTIANLQKTIQGLDRRVSQLQVDASLSVDREAALVAERDEARTNLAAAAETIDGYVQRVPGLEAELATANDSLTARSADAQRAQMVATEFPSLAPLLHTGGLPAFVEEGEYRVKLSTITKALHTIAGGQQQQKFQGATPPAAPPASAPGDRGQVLKDLHSSDAAVRGRAQKQWEELASR